MNAAHPFREGNGRARRIWLDLIFKKEIQQVVDWNRADKEEYLSAMQRKVVKDLDRRAVSCYFFNSTPRSIFAGKLLERLENRSDVEATGGPQARESVPRVRPCWLPC